MIRSLVRELSLVPRLPGRPAAVLLLAVAGCANAPALSDESEGAAASHEESRDLVVPADTAQGKADGRARSFDRNRVLAEDFFLATDAVDAAAVQRFLESTPYDGLRSWLADETVGGRPASEAIVEVARSVGINPVVLLARMQVEKSLVSRERRPSGSAVEYAFGCGCFDWEDCNPAYAGLDKQMRCAADTMRRLHDRSVDGSGEWRAGFATRTLDPLSVTPESHATASMYGYTPWVLVGRGGNWLAWNVTRKFALHFEEQGLLQLGRAYDDEAWIGSPCTQDATCGYVRPGGAAGFCSRYAGEAGICSLPCAGGCPDRSGEAVTFCASLDGGHSGQCLARASGDSCEADGLVPASLERFVGDSGATHATATVCAPAGY